jgi:hypothetical protein
VWLIFDVRQKMKRVRSIALSGEWFSFLWRFTVNSVMVWAVLGIYVVLCNHPPSEPTVVQMPSWVPFWPGFTAPYLAALLVPWLLPLAIHSVRQFFACWCAMVLGYTISIALFASFPTTLPRTQVPPGGWTGLYRGLVAIDPPNNVMPCAHVIGPMIVAWFVVRGRPAWRWPLMGMVALAAASVALTWQHRPIDIVIGMGISGVAIATGDELSRRLWAKEPNKAPEPTTMAVTSRAPSSTSRASHGRGSS